MAMERLPTINFFWPVIIFIGGGAAWVQKIILGVSECKKIWETLIWVMNSEPFKGYSTTEAICSHFEVKKKLGHSLLRQQFLFELQGASSPLCLLEPKVVILYGYSSHNTTVL